MTPSKSNRETNLTKLIEAKYGIDDCKTSDFQDLIKKAALLNGMDNPHELAAQVKGRWRAMGDQYNPAA